MLLTGVLENGQFLVGEVLRSGRNAQVSNGFHVVVHEKGRMVFSFTDKDYMVQFIV